MYRSLKAEKAEEKTMSAREIKDEIQKLEPTEKLEIFRWVSNQMYVAEFNWDARVYRSLGNPLRADQKLRVIS